MDGTPTDFVEGLLHLMEPSAARSLMNTSHSATALDESKLSLTFCLERTCNDNVCYCCPVQKPIPYCYKTLEGCREVCPKCTPKCLPLHKL
ncbi:hypothetical protein EJB05_49233, partial [Eragrostis curvula]